jgi:NCS1 family nucleobase:cation symporter-1
VDLHDETPGSQFWYVKGFNPAGVIAMVVASGVALLCVDTALYVGPIAGALDGADLSGFVGPILGASIYAAITLRQRRSRPGGEPSTPFAHTAANAAPAAAQAK